MADGENWSWKKFFSGFVDGKVTGKALAITFHQLLIGTILVFSVLGVIYVKGKLFPKKDEQRVVKVDSQGGAVDASQKTDKKQFNFLNFGGTNQ